jgi:hypothetical protein
MVVDFFKICFPSILTNLVRVSILTIWLTCYQKTPWLVWTLLSVNLFFLEFYLFINVKHDVRLNLNSLFMLCLSCFYFYNSVTIYMYSLY